MSRYLQQIQDELESMGYETEKLSSQVGEVVTFQYRVETGNLRGELVTLGISMQGNEPYPEYPPHWVHLTPPIDDGRGHRRTYLDSRGREWVALSRPPGEIWDSLPVKNMESYLSEHLRCFWYSI